MDPFIIHTHKCFEGAFKAGTFLANTEKALTFDVKTKVWHEVQATIHTFIHTCGQSGVAKHSSIVRNMTAHHPESTK